MIDITLLGTSALLPIPQRGTTAAALTCCGHTILFDCGEGTQIAARRYSVSLLKTDIIALTHYHGDHFFGLPGLLQTVNMGRTEPLYIVGPTGLEEAMEPILKLVGPTEYEIRLLTMPEEGIRLCELIKGWPGEARLSAFKTEHRIPSQGYAFSLGRLGKFQVQKAIELGIPVDCWGILQHGKNVQVGDMTFSPEQVMNEPRRGLKFVFSGDTTVCDSLIQAASEADILICEATYGENEQAQLAAEHGHMTFAQAAQVAASARARCLWLAHYSQIVEEPEIYLPISKAIFENTVCGTDGMSVTLKFEK